MKYTRFGIIYSVSKLSRFISNPNLDHWKAIKRYSNIWGAHELYKISSTQDLKSISGCLDT